MIVIKLSKIHRQQTSITLTSLKLANCLGWEF